MFTCILPNPFPEQFDVVIPTRTAFLKCWCYFHGVCKTIQYSGGWMIATCKRLALKSEREDSTRRGLICSNNRTMEESSILSVHVWDRCHVLDVMYWENLESPWIVFKTSIYIQFCNDTLYMHCHVRKPIGSQENKRNRIDAVTIHIVLLFLEVTHIVNFHPIYQ
jgi:hypothetical protein